jgi:large subunit ribosomal protein L11
VKVIKMAKEKIDALIKGGQASAAPPLGPALGPLGVNTGLVISEINEKTSAFKGIDVPVKIIVDTTTKKFEIVVGTPPVSSMLKRELKKDKLTSAKDGVVTQAGDLPLEKIISIAKSKTMPGRDLKAKVKQVLGTCLSGGVTVSGKNAREVIKEIDEGKIKIDK